MSEIFECECGHPMVNHYRATMGGYPLSNGQAICGAANCFCGDYKALGNSEALQPQDLTTKAETTEETESTK